MAQPATRSLGRLSEIAQVMVRHGFGYFLEAHKLTDLLPGRSAELRLSAAESSVGSARGQHLRELLDELGPTFVKFGQLLSTRPDVVPPDIIAELRGLQDDVRPFPFEQAERVIEEDLGNTLERLFLSFDPVPVAAASIGQVHRAVWHDGREVAVKIQYPGAGKALISDLNQISRVARVATVWIPGIEMGPILDELKSRMSEELDYNLEARSQAKFAKGFDGDPHYVIPKVVKNSEHVIVSEWLEGRPLSQIIEKGTVAERDIAAQLYMEFLLEGPDRIGLLHADPHPGNYRMTPDGRLGIIDFGAVNRLPHGLPPEMGTFLQLALEGDAQGTLDGLRAIGFVRPGMDLDAQRLLDYLEPFVDPLRTDRFRFTREWIREVFSHINDPRRPNYTVGMKLNLPPDYLLIHRVWIGGIGVLCQLGGEIEGRRIVGDHLVGADLPPVGA